MNDFSLIEKLKILMKLVSSSTLFLICAIIVVLILMFLIICIVKNKKVNKWVIILIFSLTGLILFVNYGSLILKIIDIIIDGVFRFLYFPNLPIYISILIISNICFAISMFNKKDSKLKKIINLLSSGLLDFLFILIINVVSKYNINIYEEINLYTNSTLLILLELSTGIFTSWILVRLFESAHLKLKKYDKVEEKILPEIIFD